MIKEKNRDWKDIDLFVSEFFKDHHNGMDFCQFKEKIVNTSSEPYFVVYSQFQEHIPCF